MIFNLSGSIPSLPATYNNVVVVSTTAQLKVGLGRSLAIDF
jgi:hypothetical protein